MSDPVGGHLTISIGRLSIVASPSAHCQVVSMVGRGRNEQQICLAVLFFFSIANGVIFVVYGVLMIVLIVLTLSAQILFSRSFLRT